MTDTDIDAPPKRQHDPSELSLREMGEISALFDAPLADVLQGVRQSDGIAAVAWLLIRRDDPTFTYDQALDLRMKDFEIVNEVAAAPKAVSPVNGDAPPTSPASGV
jgi:hypothetical protein